jgi:hypothetical protein
VTRAGTLATAAVAAASVGLAACGGDDDKSSSSPTAPPTPRVVTDKPGHPTFIEVQKVSIPIFKDDPECPVPEWHANSTGVDAPYRKSVEFFRQLDCLKSQGGLPDRIQQSLYIQFKDRKALDRYVKAGHAGQADAYLRSDRILVTLGSGLQQLDGPAYLKAVSEACRCGRIEGT